MLWFYINPGLTLTAIVVLSKYFIMGLIANASLSKQAARLGRGDFFSSSPVFFRSANLVEHLLREFPRNWVIPTERICYQSTVSFATAILEYNLSQCVWKLLSFFSPDWQLHSQWNSSEFTTKFCIKDERKAVDYKLYYRSTKKGRMQCNVII